MTAIRKKTRLSQELRAFVLRILLGYRALSSKAPASKGSFEALASEFDKLDIGCGEQAVVDASMASVSNILARNMLGSVIAQVRKSI